MSTFDRNGNDVSYALFAQSILEKLKYLVSISNNSHKRSRLSILVEFLGLDPSNSRQYLINVKFKKYNIFGDLRRTIQCTACNYFYCSSFE
jgi:hypothetical protein